MALACDFHTKNSYSYPHKFDSTLVPAEFHKKYNHIKTGESIKDDKIEFGARIITTRSYGNKLRFYDVKSGV
jgi:lysyl-tRNA synthetase class 2